MVFVKYYDYVHSVGHDNNEDMDVWIINII